MDHRLTIRLLAGCIRISCFAVYQSSRAQTFAGEIPWSFSETVHKYKTVELSRPTNAEETPHGPSFQLASHRR